MITAVIFDCFGVLYLDASKHFYEHHIPQYEKLWPQLMELNKQSDYGLITQDELVDGVVELTGAERDFVADNIRGVHQRNEKLLEFAESLRPKYKLGMLSNIGPGAMDSFFSPRERDELFDAVILSGDVGVVKPNPAIYELMAEQLSVSTRECVMIDDIEDNCAGADAAGMRAIHYRSNPQVKRDLAELLEETGSA